MSKHWATQQDSNQSINQSSFVPVNMLLQSNLAAWHGMGGTDHRHARSFLAHGMAWRIFVAPTPAGHTPHLNVSKCGGIIRVDVLLVRVLHQPSFYSPLDPPLLELLQLSSFERFSLVHGLLRFSQLLLPGVYVGRLALGGIFIRMSPPFLTCMLSLSRTESILQAMARILPRI